MTVKDSVRGYYSVADQYAKFGIDEDLDSMSSNGFSGLSIELLKSTLNDPKPLVLTHWLETNTNDYTVRYNVYEKIKDVDYDLPMAMLNEFKAVATLVKSKLETGNYTHLVVACSGWNNFQDDSTGLYEDWIKFSKDAAHADGMDFRPLVIGFTWASRWIIPGISIFNKANDADELGMTHVNVLLWKYILPCINHINIPVVTIGHSFGARVMSRADHSRFLLRDVDASTWIDKAIDFQGAYPLSRFCRKKGSNGGLYTANIPVRKHFMTYSSFDYAVKNAIWSTYIGNNKSASILQNDPVAKNDFEFTSIDETGRLDSYTGEKRKILIDAEKMIKTINSRAAGAHNDVRDEEAGRFIWEVLKL